MSISLQTTLMTPQNTISVDISHSDIISLPQFDVVTWELERRHPEESISEILIDFLKKEFEKNYPTHTQEDLILPS